MLLVLKEWRFLQLHILGGRTSFTLVSRRGSSEKRESVAQEVAPPRLWHTWPVRPRILDCWSEAGFRILPTQRPGVVWKDQQRHDFKLIFMKRRFTGRIQGSRMLTSVHVGLFLLGTFSCLPCSQMRPQDWVLEWTMSGSGWFFSFPYNWVNRQDSEDVGDSCVTRCMEVGSLNGWIGVSPQP